MAITVPIFAVLVLAALTVLVVYLVKKHCWKVSELEKMHDEEGREVTLDSSYTKIV